MNLAFGITEMKVLLMFVGLFWYVTFHCNSTLRGHSYFDVTGLPFFYYPKCFILLSHVWNAKRDKSVKNKI